MAEHETRTTSDFASEPGGPGGARGQDSAGDDRQQWGGSPFGGPGGFAAGERAERARRVYATWNQRVAQVRAQPSWAQKLVGYLVLAFITGVVLIVGVVALIVGLLITLPIIALLLVQKAVAKLTGSGGGGGGGSAGPRDSGRSNVRVITRRG